MSSVKNKYNLSRDIPSDVSREVRAKCSFGCIFCGSFIVQYDHYDPPFIEAKNHDAKGIVLLCPSHHQAKTGSQISVEMIKAKLVSLESDPRDTATWDFEHEKNPQIFFGKSRIEGVRKILQIDGQEILSIDPPSEVNAPPRINAKFYDSRKNLVAEIDSNTWICSSSSWDAECTGKKFIIREKYRDICLELELDGGVITIRRLNMLYGSTHVEIKRDGTVIVQTHGEKGAMLRIPNVPTLTKDSLRWIDVNRSVIRWSADNIPSILDSTDPNLLPL